MLLLLALACASEPAVPEPADPAPLPASPPTEEAPPAGSISGVPILPQTVVLGGLDAAAVDAVIERKLGALDACIADARSQDPALAGKVLVRFTVLGDGTVGDARVRSTSLRHDATEQCVLGVVQRARFPELTAGEKAVVDLPVVFATSSR